MTTMRHFGTDGVRGRVGQAPMTVDFALRLASAAARVLAPQGGRVLIGKDTRLSGYLFESALEAGFVAAGVDVMLIGPLPTPGIAYMTQRLACKFGVVISASHNSYEDNGIKFFDATGSKLSDDIEDQIERQIDEPVITQESQHLGRALRIDRSRTQYQEFCASTIPAGMTLDGMKIVIDCANGAGYKVAPRVLADLGAEIVPIGCSPNGRNINDGCGSTSPELLQLTVPGVRAQVGLALDGDGDRVVMVDELGRCVDGDQLLFILAMARRNAGELHGPVVGTVMSNLGLEHALAERGIEFRRAQVGDRYVLAMLNEAGGTLGGETSGHILCLDKTTTGDGLVSALQVLAVMKATGAGLAELAAPMRRYPQVLLNVPVARRFDPMREPKVVAAASAVERRFNGRGRIVLRASGTESLIRVMVEGADAGLVKQGARDIVAAVEAAVSDAVAGRAAVAEAGAVADGVAVSDGVAGRAAVAEAGAVDGVAGGAAVGDGGPRRAAVAEEAGAVADGVAVSDGVAGRAVVAEAGALEAAVIDGVAGDVGMTEAAAISGVAGPVPAAAAGAAGATGAWAAAAGIAKRR